MWFCCSCLFVCLIVVFCFVSFFNFLLFICLVTYWSLLLVVCVLLLLLFYALLLVWSSHDYHYHLYDRRLCRTTLLHSARSANHLDLRKILVYFAKRPKGWRQNLYSFSSHRDYFSPRGQPHSPVPSRAVPSGQNVFIQAACKEYSSWDIPIAAICSTGMLFWLLEYTFLRRGYLAVLWGSCKLSAVPFGLECTAYWTTFWWNLRPQKQDRNSWAQSMMRNDLILAIH